MASSNSKYAVALTPNEQAVYLDVLRKKICSLTEVTEVTGNYDTSRVTMSRLAAKGYVTRVHRGYYAGVPPEHLGGEYEVDRYLIAHKVSNLNGALAFHSALELHGVAQSYFNTVYYLRPKPLRNFEFQGIEYKYPTDRRIFGITTIMREGIGLPVTDRERTFLDCIKRPEHCGGLEELLKSLATFHKIDTCVLDRYLRKFGEHSLAQKTGFVLWLLKEELNVPDDYLNDLRKRVKEKIYYLATKPNTGTGRLMPEWNLIVPKNMAEMKTNA